MRQRRLGRGLGDLTPAPFPGLPEKAMPARPHVVPREGEASAPPDGFRTADGARVPDAIPAAPVAATRSIASGPDAAPAAPRPAVVAVASGKGGTGKSVITSNLAVHLAASGQRVLAIDADMGLANLHLLLGVRPARTIREVIEAGAGLDDVAEIGPVGVRLAAGGSGVTELADMHPARLRRLVTAIDGLGGWADVVLLDTGAGIGRATTTFLYDLREILVVTTPDLTAMADAYAVIKNVARSNPGARLLLVVNRVATAVEGIEIFARMDRISQKFLGRTLSYLGHVLEDPRVPASVAARLPILLNQPAAPAAACLRGIGRALWLEIGARRAAGPEAAS